MLAKGFYNTFTWCSADFKNDLEMERSSEVSNKLPDATQSSTVMQVLPGCIENERDLLILCVSKIQYEGVHMGLWRTTVLTTFKSEFTDR